MCQKLRFGPVEFGPARIVALSQHPLSILYEFDIQWLYLRHSLQITDSLTAFLDGLTEDLKHFCIFSIESTLNTSSDDPEQQPDFVNNLLQQVGDVSCPGTPTLCSGHGTCTEGHCVCDAGKVTSSDGVLLLLAFRCIIHSYSYSTGNYGRRCEL